MRSSLVCVRGVLKVASVWSGAGTTMEAVDVLPMALDGHTSHRMALCRSCETGGDQSPYPPSEKNPNAKPK